MAKEVRGGGDASLFYRPLPLPNHNGIIISTGRDPGYLKQTMKITSTKVIAGALVVMASPIVLISSLVAAGLAQHSVEQAGTEIGKNISFITWVAQKPQCLPRQFWNEVNDVSAGGKYATYIKHCRV